MQLKAAAFLAAVMAAVAFPTGAEETTPQPEATLSLLLPSMAGKAAVQLKRYKKTLLLGWVEYNLNTCKQISSGKWNHENPDAKRGKVSFGTLQATATSGPCAGKKYTYAVLYYTWTKHNNESITDKFGARWTTPDGKFNYLYKIPIKVKVVRPVGETTAFSGWDAKGLGKWRQKLKPPADDPDFDFSYDTVREANPGGGGPDTCWFKDSAIDKFKSITGGTWFPDESGVWEFDHVGWFTTSVKYYRDKGRTPCGTTFPQQMRHKAQAGGGFVDYGPVNTLGGRFTKTKVTTIRAGKTHTEVR